MQSITRRKNFQCRLPKAVGVTAFGGRLHAGLLAGWLATLAAGGAAEPGRLELRNERVTLGLGQAEHGAIVSLQDAGHQEFVAAQKNPRLFTLSFSKKAAPPGEQLTLTSGDAKSFKGEIQRAGQAQVATLVYEGFAQWPFRVVCTASVTNHDPLVYWRIAVQVPEGLVLESVRFPFVVLRAPLGQSGEDDAAVVGSTKGGVIRRPGGMKVGSLVSIAQPGNMAAQFGCYYDERAGFYTAALDGRGHPKHLTLGRVNEGIEISWIQAGFATGTVAREYDVVMTTFTGNQGAPADWRDAADLYKEWALKQPWCATPYAQRQDIPAWMKAGPAIVRFGREWLAEPDRIERWLSNYWQKQFPQAPLIMAYWGWEKIGTWVTPDYFPVFPSDEQFTKLVERSRAFGAHAFPWPSGYHWTLTYRKNADGGFEWDDRKRFDTVARTHAVQTRDGKLYLRTPSWLDGGDTACLCGGDPWTLRWWNEDICVPLAKRGCEMIQIDQVVGGKFPACYDSTHPHPPGPGVWQTEAFDRQLQTMLATMRKTQPEAVVCFEEPNEWFNHRAGIQDYRDCESPHEWASVFNYLYHEFLPTFQSNPRGNDLMMSAYCLVNGQMPHLVPSGRDLSETVLVNGGFEPRASGRNPLAGWDQVHAYQGRNWTGRAFSDSKEKHGGSASLRLENTNASDIVQVSQNVSASTDGFAVGKKYRLSAWLKTDQMAAPNAIGFGLFATGMKSLGKGGQLRFPAAGTGWTRVAAEFTVPAETTTMRIMINLSGLAKAWVDDMALEELSPDGTVTPATYSTASPETKFMQRWVTLYHGEGRPWLQFGRMLHPPKLTCDTTSYKARTKQSGGKIAYNERTTAAVLHNAFHAPDGTEAVVLANATLDPQHVTLEWKGKSMPVDVPPAGAMLLK
ncbi:MAG: DUF6259 domain-containing protein [Verrucomicrobiota bacterium]